MLDVSNNALLVGASLLVALMSGFTGLTLTHGISGMSLEMRKLRVVMAAVVLGGGIWAMHFIAMLGIELPIYFYYDTLTTLSSALVAILLVGVALLILHFVKRTATSMTAAGCVLASGILSMHYIGMSGMRLCSPVYSTWGLSVAVVGAVLLSNGVVWAAYSRRTQLNVLSGTAVFGVAVFSTHFLAMAGTGFVAAPALAPSGVPIDNAALAIGVALLSFALCGGFLLMGVRLLPEAEAHSQALADAPPPAGDVPRAEGRSAAAATDDADRAEPALASADRPIGDGHKIGAGSSTSRDPIAKPLAVPYEVKGRTHFIDQSEIAAIRAEGRYTILFVGDRRLLCPWSISELAKRLAADQFIQTHRSYLINPDYVSRFERRKDSGYCYFRDIGALEKAPVSRGRMTIVRERLGG